ncbi:hypothetical protein N9L68_05910 [bacterium]|nr:hypothetical protein [bacterium]
MAAMEAPPDAVLGVGGGHTPSFTSPAMRPDAPTAAFASEPLLALASASGAAASVAPPPQPAWAPGPMIACPLCDGFRTRGTA